ncbi:MAG: DUF951 domain-containing protein [Chloroflexi bacterium]|nr:DUF951 domain-containing protein [Chloroflexota bacterium]
MDFQIDDVLRLKKRHPCGSHQWQVYRLGADIGIVCQGCGRRVLMPRRDLERYTRGISRSASLQPSAEAQP